MNYNFGGPSNIQFHSSSLSSSNCDDAINVEEKVLYNMMQNNIEMVQYVLDEQNRDTSHGGSVPGYIVINHDREVADRKLFNNYFSDNPRYNEEMFRRRYRMSRNLFLRITDAVKGHDHYFHQRCDGISRLGVSTLQKTTAVFQMLAYGFVSDATDEYIKIGELMAIESLKRFCRAINEIFLERYLRSPNANDISRLLYIGERRGFPRINLAQGIAPPTNYVIHGKEYDMGYYLADSIYPKWSNIVQTIHDPRDLFFKKQEACRKDVERAFGVLQSRFAIVAGPTRFWKKYVLHDIMTACIIMNNMIIEDELDLSATITNVTELPEPVVEMETNEHVRFQQFLPQHKKIKNKDAHIALCNDLFEYLWSDLLILRFSR
ncbi:uncharacterized protein LOC126672607 [Mercurialis annua]|uniref:uncharacterized protein LOC126672607 n=1 Tax=Mercurialis annua TaxID=3986 RepID=UPI00215E82ED|nr:uncharacterized protein LOC126672607 [Mercurialis annua]